MELMMYDIKRWKVHDADWLKQRKSQWREVKSTLREIRELDAYWIPAIKEFFYTDLYHQKPWKGILSIRDM